MTAIVIISFIVGAGFAYAMEWGGEAALLVGFAVMVLVSLVAVLNGVKSDD